MSDVKFFTTKPRLVTAIKWTGENANEVQTFLYGGHPHAADGWVKGSYVDVSTPSGLMVASIGHWITRDEHGHCKVVDDEFLAKNYDTMHPLQKGAETCVG